MGALSSFTAPQLGAFVVREAVSRAGLGPEEIDEVIMGQVIQAGSGQNPARQSALGAGLPPAVAALTLNKVCGSSLKAVVLAAQAIKLGDADRIRHSPTGGVPLGHRRVGGSGARSPRRRGRHCGAE